METSSPSALDCPGALTRAAKRPIAHPALSIDPGDNRDLVRIRAKLDGRFAGPVAFTA